MRLHKLTSYSSIFLFVFVLKKQMSSGCSSMSSMGKKKKGPALMTKVLKKKKLCKAKKKVAPVPLIPGTKIVVETLSTSTKANVVWQDGSVELGKPSISLIRYSYSH